MIFLDFTLRVYKGDILILTDSKKWFIEKRWILDICYAVWKESYFLMKNLIIIFDKAVVFRSTALFK